MKPCYEVVVYLVKPRKEREFEELYAHIRREMSALPGFASSPIRDPRAPQNLYPIGALEDHLRRRMGDQEFIRRSIEAHLFQEVAA